MTKMFISELSSSVL